MALFVRTNFGSTCTHTDRVAPFQTISVLVFDRRLICEAIVRVWDQRYIQKSFVRTIDQTSNHELHVRIQDAMSHRQNIVRINDRTYYSGSFVRITTKQTGLAHIAQRLFRYSDTLRCSIKFRCFLATRELLMIRYLCRNSCRH